jgi:hypothetical protein
MSRLASNAEPLSSAEAAVSGSFADEESFAPGAVADAATIWISTLDEGCGKQEGTRIVATTESETVFVELALLLLLLLLLDAATAEDDDEEDDWPVALGPLDDGTAKVAWTVLAPGPPAVPKNAFALFSSVSSTKDSRVEGRGTLLPLLLLLLGPGEEESPWPVVIIISWPRAERMEEIAGRMGCRSRSAGPPALCAWAAVARAIAATLPAREAQWEEPAAPLKEGAHKADREEDEERTRASTWKLVAEMLSNRAHKAVVMAAAEGFKGPKKPDGGRAEMPASTDAQW